MGQGERAARRGAVIRTNRPLVLISRFQGNQRDGHGNHQTAGVITQEAFKAAGDPAQFPEQIKEGLRPWQPLKVYIGGVRENEDWTIRVDPGRVQPVARRDLQQLRAPRPELPALADQRPLQSAGRTGRRLLQARRIASSTRRAKEQSFFDGIDTTLPGLFKSLEKPAPAGGDAALAAIEPR